MSLFLNNIPQASDNLDFSQGQLLSNNQGLDTVFGVDHYKFSDASANKGFHNTVTTPPYVATPTTGLPPVTGANPIFYGFQQTTPLGVLQYSEGPNAAVPTPVTAIQSSVTGLAIANGTSINILDFTGIPRAFGTLFAMGVNSSSVNIAITCQVFWTGTAFIFLEDTGSGSLFVTSSGNILQLSVLTGQSNLTGVYWTLYFYRLS